MRFTTFCGGLCQTAPRSSQTFGAFTRHRILQAVYTHGITYLFVYLMNFHVGKNVNFEAMR